VFSDAMPPTSPVLALAVNPRILREALQRVLDAHCVIVVLDEERADAAEYDIVVTDDLRRCPLEGRAVIDLSGDEAELHLPGVAEVSRIGTVADLVDYVMAQGSDRAPLSRR
jgi:hypothetical protein